MDPGRALRAARQQAELSQRALAAAAGVSPTTVADLESGRSDPRWSLVTALLAAASRDLQLGLPELAVDDGLRQWLQLSTSQRLYWSIGGRLHHRRDHRNEVWNGLGTAARGRRLVLDPEVAVGVWLPDRPAPQPVRVHAVTARDHWGRCPPFPTSLAVAIGPVALTGLVPVGVSARSEVWVHPPDAPQLQRDPATARSLRTAGRLLDELAPRDLQGRRPAAHKDSRVQYEYDWVMARRRFGPLHLPTPDPRDRRDWRLGGEASFRAWLTRRGYPLRDHPGRDDWEEDDWEEDDWEEDDWEEDDWPEDDAPVDDAPVDDGPEPTGSGSTG
jgi:transcriptional regulator with XRE-family HTH domain